MEDDHYSHYYAGLFYADWMGWDNGMLLLLCMYILVVYPWLLLLLAPFRTRLLYIYSVVVEYGVVSYPMQLDWTDEADMIGIAITS